MPIIPVSGKLGAGKDTWSGHLSRLGYENRKFASKLKHICSILTGLPYEYFSDRTYYDTYIDMYDTTVREMLQHFATETCREHFDPLIWVKALMADYTPEKCWVISDLRFKNEAEYLRLNYPNVFMVRLEGTFEPEKQSNHISEIDLDDYPHFNLILNVHDYSLDEIPNMAKNIVKWAAAYG